ncbi:hypothetical protein [Nocardioides caricicola]|uniref:Uncharacterized protein n=1 Tax=Nocardioides caricicola TaxID=634770 RepID=A0ABW0MWY8_9ACTN
MGHYHRIVNLTQHQVITPMDTGVLDKLLEFGQSSATAMAALWLLLGREAWCGDRIAILGYEGRRHDLSPEVVAETGHDGTAFYDTTLRCAGELARSVLVERGICSFTSEAREGYDVWRSHPSEEVRPAGVDVVAADLDRHEVLDPVQFGDDRDLHLAAATGGLGGVTTALTAVLAGSNKLGGRGGGDFCSTDPIIGSWAGDHIGVVPLAAAHGFTDISAEVRRALTGTGEFAYREAAGRVTRADPPWRARAISHLDAG